MARTATAAVVDDIQDPIEDLEVETAEAEEPGESPETPPQS